jgi:hypothetical protein
MLSATLVRDDAAEARDVIRGLVESITLVPDDGRLRIEVPGELAAILRLAEGARSGGGAGVSEAFCLQLKMVAGAGFGRRLPLPAVGC